MALVTIAKTTDLQPGQAKVVEVVGASIALFNVGGAFHAIENSCCHNGGPLGEGDLEGNLVSCPWHGWRFDVTTGRCVAPDLGVCVRLYEVRLEAGEVRVET